MGETTIEWCDFTFNPWWGCTKVSPGCDNCYAEMWAKRTGWPTLWDTDAFRRTFGAKHWADPIKWNAKAKKEGRRLRVFCASMADVFDKDAPTGARADLWELIEDTPHLDWLLLTKRVGNVMRMVPGHWRYQFPANVWLGASIVNQVEADRDLPKLCEIPIDIRFVSGEPLLGPIDFLPYLDNVHWIIVGGESGSHARPMLEQWAHRICNDCATAGVPFFFKQGSQANWPTFKDFTTFPEVLQVREWPASTSTESETQDLK